MLLGPPLQYGGCDACYYVRDERKRYSAKLFDNLGRLNGYRRWIELTTGAGNTDSWGDMMKSNVICISFRCLSEGGFGTSEVDGIKTGGPFQLQEMLAQVLDCSKIEPCQPSITVLI